GLGDNSDLFPNDSMAKYDSDGDGIANYYDAFPNNPNMDNWFDLMMRIGAVIFVVGAAFIGFKTIKQRSDEGPDWDNQDELYLAAAENNELDRPTGPPPPGSFQ
ncbi:MAG: hypothetical protein QF588_01410, partial [Candidatus Poseidoniaceae archaeon]|nr:hypothetical protein [Candidatus Poseidoniaceae archaeon]